MNDKVAMKLADEHVEWFLKTIRPLLKDHMVYGFKHGYEYAQTENVKTTRPVVCEARTCRDALYNGHAA